MAKTLTPEEEEQIVQALLAWREAGEENPTIPLFDDVDGDGVPDFYGLDGDGKLTVVSGATLESSVYVSEGEDAS
ncbi:hypothetical protein QWJ90_01250 [Microbacterium oryzae]|uniref:hypothetical protein n=1 Tax=Microbacterium oryzae TaxID=743009 RepID=UPI0025AEF801|nr:hypothetical protein [Microbacterium oryzae]MDN3309548.1 hypothetical protein [Microbacterium oryzae]